MDVRSETLYAPLWARFSEDGVPWLAGQPASRQVECGGDAAFGVEPASGYDNLTYQWRKDGVLLTSGPTGSGSMIVLSGADLEILNVNQGDASTYDCIVSNLCGQTTSFPATFTVIGDCPGEGCTADFNSDGAVNSQDYFDLLTAFFTAPPPPAADFNGDGDFNSQDFFDFLTSFFDGCP
jgi:hypothetical protein